jgi:hypothetical protein
VAPNTPWEFTWIESGICSAKDVQTLGQRMKGSWNVRSRSTRLPAKEIYLYQEKPGHVRHHDLKSVRIRMDLSCSLDARRDLALFRCIESSSHLQRSTRDLRVLLKMTASKYSRRSARKGGSGCCVVGVLTCGWSSIVRSLRYHSFRRCLCGEKESMEMTRHVE